MSIIRKLIIAHVAVECANHVRFRRDAILAIQEAAEMFLVQRFGDANRAALDAKRVTIMPKDIHLVRAPRKTVDCDLFEPIIQ